MLIRHGRTARAGYARINPDPYHPYQSSRLGAQFTELICMVVSNINGCSKCTAGHVKKALALGLTHEHIDEAVKVSAVMTSFNTFHRSQ